METATRNADLADLAKLLQVQHDAKHDAVVPAQAITARGGLLHVAGMGPDGPVGAPGTFRRSPEMATWDSLVLDVEGPALPSTDEETEPVLAVIDEAFDAVEGALIALLAERLPGWTVRRRP